MILVGRKNRVNDKLIREISELTYVHFIEIDHLLDPNKIRSTELCPKTETRVSPVKNEPLLTLVNLMDVQKESTQLISNLRATLESTVIIAIHSFQTPALVKRVKGMGYDDYISIFDFSKEFLSLVETHKMPT